ncbi:MAG: histidine kinase [Bacteroidota bacterium]
MRKGYTISVIFVGITVLFSPVASLAQGYWLGHYTTVDGLPSNTIYQIEQDKDGYLWLGTDNGLVRFDGTQFRSYYDSALISHEIIQLHVNSKGTIAFTNLFRQVGTIKAGELTVHSLKLDGKAYGFWDFVLDDEENFYLAPDMEFLDDLLWKDREENELRRIPSKYQRCRSLHWWSEAQKVLGIVAKTLNHTPSLMMTEVSGDTSDQFHSQYFPIPLELRKMGHLYAKINVLNGKIFMLLAPNQLFVKIGDEIKRIQIPNVEASQKFFDMEEDHLGQIWISSSSGLFQLNFQDDTTATLGMNLLQGISVNSIFKDHESNIWLGTESFGLYRLSAERYVEFKATDLGKERLSIKRLNSVGKEAVIGIDKFGDVFQFNESGWEKRNMHEPDYLNGSLIGPKQELIVYGNNLMYWPAPNNQHGVSLSLNKYAASDKTFLPLRNVKNIILDDNQLLVGGGRFFAKINVDTYEVGELTIAFRVASIWKDLNKDIIWIGQEKGLCQILPNDSMKVFESDSGQKLPKVVQNFVQKPEGSLFVGTQGSGLWIVEDGSLERIDERFDLPAKTYVDLEYAAPYIWAITEKGIMKIHEEDYSYLFLEQNKASPISEAYDIEIQGENVWISSANKILCFKVDQPGFLTSLPPVYLESFVAQNEIGELHSDRLLPYAFNEVFIRISAISFSESLAYEYRLNESAVWTRIDRPELRLSSLKSGSYQVQIRAVRLNGVKSNPPLEITFFIQTPFWRSIWFWGLIGLSLGGIILWQVRQYFQNKLEREQQRDKLNRRIAELKLQALRTQMNPHFIFNCLTSVQHLLLEEDIEQALAYLSDFARLIRLAFEHSAKEVIPLSEEIRFLTTYIDLEKFRLSQEVEVDLHIDRNLDPELYNIPPMLVQPIVENAFQHGLLHSEVSGKLDISFAQHSENILRCTVRDNGIGRERAGQIMNKWKEGTHASGLKISEERLELVNEKFPNIVSLEIEDFNNENTLSHGTEVRLLIPFTNDH